MENINVALRVRPLSMKENERNELDMWRIQKGRTIYPNEQIVQESNLNNSKLKGH